MLLVLISFYSFKFIISYNHLKLNANIINNNQSKVNNTIRSGSKHHSLLLVCIKGKNNNLFDDTFHLGYILTEVALRLFVLKSLHLKILRYKFEFVIP